MRGIWGKEAGSDSVEEGSGGRKPGPGRGNAMTLQEGARRRKRGVGLCSDSALGIRRVQA